MSSKRKYAVTALIVLALTACSQEPTYTEEEYREIVKEEVRAMMEKSPQDMPATATPATVIPTTTPMPATPTTIPWENPTPLGTASPYSKDMTSEIEQIEEQIFARSFELMMEEETEGWTYTCSHKKAPSTSVPDFEGLTWCEGVGPFDLDHMSLIRLHMKTGGDTLLLRRAFYDFDGPAELAECVARGVAREFEQDCSPSFSSISDPEGYTWLGELWDVYSEWSREWSRGD